MKRQSLRDLLGTGGHGTEYAALHPNIQANLAEAESTLQDLMGRLHDNHISDLGIESAYDGITEIFYACLDRTGAKAQELGYTPAMFRLGDPTDRFEVPSPFLITVQSSISASCAVVLVTFTDYNPVNGYGDWQTTVLDSAGVFDDLEEATNYLKQIAKAVGTLRLASREIEKVGERRSKGDGTKPAF